MKLTANCDVIMGDGSHRNEPTEVHVNPNYITQAWRAGDGGTVYMFGFDRPLHLDADSFSKAVRWLDKNEVYDVEVKA